MNTYQVEALILRSQSYRESDRLLTLLTRERGKVKAIAKGVRKPKSKLRGAVQLFSFCTLMLYRGRSLETLTQGSCRENFRFIQEDLTRLAYAHYFAELIDGLLPYKDPQPGIFDLTFGSFCLLKNDPELVAILFELRLLDLLGYRPCFNCCAVDGRPVKKTDCLWFSPQAGGIVCPFCAKVLPQAVRISPEAACALEFFQEANWSRATRLKLSYRVKNEIAGHLTNYLEHYLEKKIKSKDFLQFVKKILK